MVAGNDITYGYSERGVEVTIKFPAHVNAEEVLDRLTVAYVNLAGRIHKLGAIRDAVRETQGG